jgi:hypothetical protein
MRNKYKLTIIGGNSFHSQINAPDTFFKSFWLLHINF